MRPLREFKAEVRTAVLGLPEAPIGFNFDDLARRLGAGYQEGGPERDRLRRWITNHVGAHVLRLGRGRYAAGPDLGLDNALGAGVQLVGEIRQAFDDAGGVLSFADLLKELGREDGTLVRRVLDGAPRLYTSGTPFPGFRRVWYLADAERLALPLPGRLAAFELQTLAGGPCPDLPRLLRRRRAQVAAALAEARAFADMTVPQVVAIPAVANALDFALRAPDVIQQRADGDAETLAAWWAGLLEASGRADALATAWAELENGDAPHLMVTTVKLWRAVGAALAVSPAHLSRGCAVPLRLWSFPSQ